jgi:hypothetical protein
LRDPRHGKCPEPDWAGEGRSSDAPGDMDASPAKALAAFRQPQANEHAGGRRCAVSELCPSVIGPACPGCLPSLSRAMVGRERGWLLN